VALHFLRTKNKNNKSSLRDVQFETAMIFIVITVIVLSGPN